MNERPQSKTPTYTRIALYDDIHAEFETDAGNDRLPTAWVPPGFMPVDVVLLAGDLDTVPERAAEFVAAVRKAHRATTPILTILGNHEFYGRDFQTALGEYRLAFKGIENVHVLENDVYTLANGVRVLGTTMWSDLSAEHDFWAAKQGMNDYRNIRSNGKRLSPATTHHAFVKARAFLARELHTGDRNATIVMTHHAPSFKSNSAHYRDDSVAPAYCSNLDPFIEETGPALWVHGHLHRSVDYAIGETRILSNPRGYVGHDVNPDFQEHFVITLESGPQRAAVSVEKRQLDIGHGRG